MGLIYLGVRRYRVLLLALPLGIVALLVLGALGGSITASFSSGSSLAARQLGWEDNLVQLTHHPFGVGIGSTGAAAAKAAQIATAANPTASAQTYNPDNYYFKTLYELGVLGLWMFVLVLIGAFSSTHRGPLRPCLGMVRCSTASPRPSLPP